ncbi:MAG: stage II sporulation protein R [Firmicutes bacterium]|nr:stage II sporulation protein R [Bacillota bacterium]
MKKIVKLGLLLLLLYTAFQAGTVLSDRQYLDENLIRLHVVANSDSDADQALKLQVRDAIVESLQAAMAQMPDADTAKAYIQENLAQLQALANRTLQDAGSGDTAVVTLEKEAFSTRQYDTFTLPAGVYEALRVTIGEGEGENWWCVVFPTLCVSATSEGFADTAAGAGFSDSVTGSLSGEDGYEIRFFLLDCLGWLENLFW